MILFCGIPTEAPLALAIDAATAAGVPHLVISQRHSQHDEICLDLCGGMVDGVLVVRGQEVPLAGIRGVLARLMPADLMPENRKRRHSGPDPVLVEKSRQFNLLLEQWLEVTPARVLNRGTAAGSNLSKPYQSQLVQACGLPVPPTLVTSDPASARVFLARHGRVIFKSISSVRSIVRELTPDQFADLERIRILPTQFQAFIAGTNIRVHVVGERLFAIEIATEAVDYRYAHRDSLDVTMQPTELPEEVASRCRLVAQRLELPLCGIDLKRTPDGDYYCFEVNPSPAYSYYESHTGQPIARAIVDYLSA